jgi:hypothetical protein
MTTVAFTAEKPNKESVLAVELSPEAIAVVANESTDEALHALAIAVVENEGGLIPKEDEE